MIEFRSCGLVTTYRYDDDARGEIDLCSRCKRASDEERDLVGVLGPVLRDAHEGSCDECGRSTEGQ